MSDDEQYRPGVGTHADAARAALLRPAGVEDPGSRPGPLTAALRTAVAALAAELAGQPRLARRYRALATTTPDAHPSDHPADHLADAGPAEPTPAGPSSVQPEPAPADPGPTAPDPTAPDPTDRTAPAASSPASPASPSTGPADLVAAVLAYTRVVTRAPADAGRADVAELERVGLGAADIVALAQLVAFVSYEARVASGLALLDGAPAAEPVTAAVTAPPAPARVTTGAGPEPRFTLDTLTWAPWITPVPADGLDEEQRAVVDAHATLSTDSPYYRTLLHAPAALDHRTHVYNALMYGRGGLPRAERELVTLLVSRINGCVYCASVHGRKFAQLGRDPEAARRVLDEGATALAGDPRRAALARFTERQTATPPAATAADVAALRAAGVEGAALLDVVHCVALFGWANRLMQVLGTPSVPESCTGTSGPAAPAAVPAAGSPSRG
ncbi:peroxidase-related enzyme [Streptomyces sp. MAA16]|uniref:peroxidase-related enzyme n=1 Tax=Streptomyces sp. MAA16 TaxID=3035116 RepID=UPI002474A942|nr:peroxidase-related enzyme [Streptomyces sp. MAA16]MDH6699272.1 putative peroxidase-related enzyme [Streptomyces sp. MAA16]